MIECVKKRDIQDSGSFRQFEIFSDVNGKLQFVMITYESGITMMEIIDVETGVSKIISDLGYSMYSVGTFFTNAESLRCLVGVRNGNLFSIHYDEDFAIKDDCPLGEERKGDVYQRDNSFCVYNEYTIVFLSKDAAQEVVFYDFKKRKVFDSLLCSSESSSYCSWVRCSDISPFLLFGLSDGIILVDKKERKIIYSFPGHYFLARQIFFDFSGKFLFGICKKNKQGNRTVYLYNGGKKDEAKSDEDRSSKNEFLQDLVVEEERKIQLNICYCSFGNEVFFGQVNELGMDHIQLLEKDKTTRFSGFNNKCKFIVRNRGRDIYGVSLTKATDDTLFTYDLSLLYFVNNQISRNLVKDTDLMDRIEYLFMMEDEKVESTKISIFHSVDVICFKIFLIN